MANDPANVQSATNPRPIEIVELGLNAAGAQIPFSALFALHDNHILAEFMAHSALASFRRSFPSPDDAAATSAAACLSLIREHHDVVAMLPCSTETHPSEQRPTAPQPLNQNCPIPAGS